MAPQADWRVPGFGCHAQPLPRGRRLGAPPTCVSSPPAGLFTSRYLRSFSRTVAARLGTEAPTCGGCRVALATCCPERLTGPEWAGADPTRGAGPAPPGGPGRAGPISDRRRVDSRSSPTARTPRSDTTARRAAISSGCTGRSGMAAGSTRWPRSVPSLLGCRLSGGTPNWPFRSRWRPATARQRSRWPRPARRGSARCCAGWTGASTRGPRARSTCAGSVTRWPACTTRPTRGRPPTGFVRIRWDHETFFGNVMVYGGTPAAGCWDAAAGGGSCPVQGGRGADGRHHRQRAATPGSSTPTCTWATPCSTAAASS